VRVRVRRDRRLGYLQLCSDRRFHRATMTAFEESTGLAPTAYWVEAVVGGAPAYALRPRGAEYARSYGARLMGWAAHGDGCGAFPGADDARIRGMLEVTVARRRLEYPDAEHLVFFGAGRRVSRLG
jgi:hypothetical protein